jgi:hypothetical protein
LPKKDFYLKLITKKHCRQTSGSEIQLRKVNLKQALKVIQQHIIDSISGTTYNLGLTSLSDLVSSKINNFKFL